MNERALVVVAWHNEKQRELFQSSWGIKIDDERVVFQQDKHKEGCARTKNKGVEEAMRRGADIVIVLDDDCFPSDDAAYLEELIEKHVMALAPQSVEMFSAVTNPPSRGTPYFNRSIKMPVAASMGYWLNVGDYDAPGQLVHGATNPMTFYRGTIHGKYFAQSGMNIAYRPREWLPWCQFIDVPRMDDVWMGFLLQRHAYSNGHCFNLGGPLVTHSRQSSVFQNLRDEAVHLERNETLWSDIAQSKETDYDRLRELLPV